MKRLPKKKKSDVMIALKSTARVFVGILFAYLTLALPYSLYYSFFIGFFGFIVLACVVSFGWFWFALWRQKVSPEIDEE